MKVYRHLLSITLALLLCCSWSGVQAQQGWQETEKTNLFKYGNPVTDEEVNIDNFVTNFPLCVQNADEIDILEIEYVGKIKNTQQAMELIRHNIHHDAPAWGVTASYGGNDEQDKKNHYFRLRTNARIDTAKENISEICILPPILTVIFP